MIVSRCGDNLANAAAHLQDRNIKRATPEVENEDQLIAALIRPKESAKYPPAEASIVGLNVRTSMRELHRGCGYIGVRAARLLNARGDRQIHHRAQKFMMHRL